ncbi:hypothetical protein MMC26_005983 [Xylographa opegraphella]|nr:hypothetical protein [Xylographa opegraphella]
MNPNYSQMPPTQAFQQLVFQYICSFNGTTGMKKLETMALAQLQQTAAGNLPLPMMRTIVQQAIEEYKQLRRTTHPQRMMAPRPTTHAPPYHQLPFQHASMGVQPQQSQDTPARPPGLFTPNSTVGGRVSSATGNSALAYPLRFSRPNSAVENNVPSTSQHIFSHPPKHAPAHSNMGGHVLSSELQYQHTPTYTSGLPPPSFAVENNVPSTSQHTPPHAPEYSRPNSIMEGDVSSTSRYQSTTTYTSGLPPPSSAVGDNVTSTFQHTLSYPPEHFPSYLAVGGDVPSTSQSYRTQTYTSGPPPPSSAVGGSGPSTFQHQPISARSSEYTPPSSVARSSPSSTSQRVPAPQVLTPPSTPKTPAAYQRDPPVPSRRSALMALLQGSEPIPAASRRVRANGTHIGHMPSRSSTTEIWDEYNPRLLNSRVTHVYTPPQRVYNPIGGPSGRPGPRPVKLLPAPVVRPEWRVLNLGLGNLIWGQDANRRSR